MFENGTARVGVTDRFELFGADSAMVDTLHRIASWAAETIESIAFASIALTIDGEMWTVVSADVAARAIERSQYEAHEGPSLDAFRTGRICRIGSTVADGQWLSFREACRARSILSTASFPLASDGSRYGAMTVYARDYHAFGKHETRLGRSFADQAVMAILQARSDASELSRGGDSQTRGSRNVDRARNVIMASTGVSADAAMEVLIAQSREQGRDLQDVATDMVNSTIAPLSTTGTR
ncbi:MAG: GAF and ANTAR domain-containing protein [Ilumatobacteraceae bacterium]